MTDGQRRQATVRIHARHSFWWRLGACILVNAVRVVVWYYKLRRILLARADRAGLGWGIGVVFHGLGVFRGMKPITEEQIQREINRATGRDERGRPACRRRPPFRRISPRVGQPDQRDRLI